MAANYKAQLAQMFTSAGGSHRDLAEKYKAVLDSILQLGEDELVDGLKAFIEAIVNENVSLVISRQLLSEVAMEMAKVEDSISKAVSHYTLDIVQPRVISFEDQVGLIRQHLADIYEKEQNWKQAAQVLVGIPLETGQKQYTVDYRLETYLKIARLYLEDEDPVQGEAYINRAAQLQTQTRNDHLQIIYKVHKNFAFYCVIFKNKKSGGFISHFLWQNYWRVTFFFISICVVLGLPRTSFGLQTKVY